MVYLLECLQKTPPPVSAASQAGPRAASPGQVVGAQGSQPLCLELVFPDRCSSLRRRRQM